MEHNDWLAQQFESNRNHLRAVAYSLLGSTTDAEDAIQETWLRLARSESDTIENLSAWLTTVVSRVCLDMLRSRSARREDSIDAPEAPAIPASRKPTPETQVQMADSVGIALLVVLNRLTPPERLAFVLHDVFAIPFEDIATILGRTPAATRQLASRARKRVQVAQPPSSPLFTQQRRMVGEFLAALRSGDVEALVRMFAPDIIFRIEQAPGFGNANIAPEVHGARNTAEQAIANARGAKSGRVVLLNGEPGLMVAPGGKLLGVLFFTFEGETITYLNAIADPARLNEMEITLLADSFERA